MATIQGREAVYLTILDYLVKTLNGGTIELWGANGKFIEPLDKGLPAIAGMLADFYIANKRLPNVIFNEGKPKELIPQMEKQPGFGELLTTAEYTYRISDDDSSGAVLPMLAVACYIDRPYPVLVTGTGGEDQQPWQATIQVQGALNNRFRFSPAPYYNAGAKYPSEIPVNVIYAGAFQTWGILLMAAQYPQFLQCSDYGFVLTWEGVGIIERTFPHWLQKTLGTDFHNLELTAGPVFSGAPAPLVERFKIQYDKSRRGGLWADVIRDIVTYIVTFVSFYYAGTGLAALMAGTVNLTTIGAAVKMASNFGVDTGKVGAALNILNLTGAENLVNSVSTGNTAMDEVWDWDVGVSDADLGDYFGSLPGYQYDELGNVIDWTEMFRAFEADIGVSLPPDIWDSPINIPPSVPAMMVSGDVYLNDIPLFTPTEVEWYATNKADPAAQATAKQTAIARVTAAAPAGSAYTDIVKMANDALKLASAFYTIKQQANVAAGRTLPTGATIQTLANGTRTITYPNGQVVTLPATGNSMGNFLTGSTLIPGVPNYLVIGGGVVLAVALTSRSRR